MRARPRLPLPPPPPDPIQHTLEQTWTRYNTVVHCPAEKVLKWDPDVPGNCDTGAAFTIDHLNYGSPDWKVTVKVCAGGAAIIKTLVQEGGFQVGENSVTWDGTREPPPLGPGGTAPKGLYTYTVEADHTVGGPYYPFMCKDTDKVDPPTLGVSLAATEPEYASHDEELGDLYDVQFTVTYSVGGRPATAGTIYIYDAAFSQIASLQVDSNGNGQIPVGVYNQANGKALHTELDDIPYDNLGTFTAVFWAKETDGSANRDGQAKWARLVLFTANTINPDVPLENVLAMYEAVGGRGSAEEGWQ